MSILKGSTRPNFKRIENNFYICYTQAGFMRALREFCCGDDFYMEHLEGYPTSYPSLVVFTDGYKGYHFPRASCIHLNKIEE